MSWQRGSLHEKKSALYTIKKVFVIFTKTFFIGAASDLGCDLTDGVSHLSLSSLDARGLDPADFPTDQNAKKKCNRQPNSNCQRFGHVVGFGVLSVAPFEHVIHGQTKACDNGDESQCNDKDHEPIIPLKR